MKPHFKPLANLLQPAWRKAIILHFTFSILNSAFAAVPLAWQVTPRNPAPVAFDRHHGETLEFRCAFTGFGELPFAQAADLRLWYQTNGMGAAWWSVPASVSSNVLSATFPPQADPGADRLALFFGAPSNAYASAVLRLRHSPGFAPNVLPAPESGYTETDPVFFAWLATNDIYTAAETDAAINNATSKQDVTTWSRFAFPMGGGYSIRHWRSNLSPWPKLMVTNGAPVYLVTDEILWHDRYTILDSVPAIVTNETVVATNGFTAWTVTANGGPTDMEPPVWHESEYEGDTSRWTGFGWHDTENRYDRNAILMTFEDLNGITGEYITYTATREPICTTRNALGLARLDDLPPLTNAIPGAAARAVYDVHDLMWDETESILYWHKIRQGHDEYIAVTNIDLTHPTNAVILKAWREANR